MCHSENTCSDKRNKNHWGLQNCASGKYTVMDIENHIWFLNCGQQLENRCGDKQNKNHWGLQN